jgi:hypothetical protein
VEIPVAGRHLNIILTAILQITGVIDAVNNFFRTNLAFLG